MASDIGKTFESLPGWAIPGAVAVLFVLALLSSKKSGGGSSSYNSVTYGPIPTDPGIISLEGQRIAAQQGVITTALNAFISRDISTGQNDRDVHLATIGADVENQRTNAAAGVALRQSADQTRQIIYQAQTAKQIVDSQGATQKYLAKKQAQSSIWGSVLSFGSSALSLVGL